MNLLCSPNKRIWSIWSAIFSYVIKPLVISEYHLHGGYERVIFFARSWSITFQQNQSWHNSVWYDLANFSRMLGSCPRHLVAWQRGHHLASSARPLVGAASSSQVHGKGGGFGHWRRNDEERGKTSHKTKQGERLFEERESKNGFETSMYAAWVVVDKWLLVSID